MTAYHSGRLSPAQERFNRVLTKLRVVVERTYGKLKMRWRCVLKELGDDTQRVALFFLKFVLSLKGFA